MGYFKCDRENPMYSWINTLHTAYSFPADLNHDSDDFLMCLYKNVDWLDYQSNAVSLLFFVLLN